MWGVSGKVILYVGRIDWNKNLHILMYSMKEILRRKSDVKLVIIGRDWGNYISSLKALAKNLDIQDAVMFTGEISFNNLIKAYVDSDVFVLPSVYEGLPTAVLEAMACGTPVVATSSGGTGSLIINGFNGYIVNPSSANGFAECILKLLVDGKLRRRMGENGRQYVKENYSWEKITGKITKIYQDIVDAQKSKCVRDAHALCNNVMQIPTKQKGIDAFER